jgi:hypothetical protein
MSDSDFENFDPKVIKQFKPDAIKKRVDSDSRSKPPKLSQEAFDTPLPTNAEANSFVADQANKLSGLFHFIDLHILTTLKPEDRHKKSYINDVLIDDDDSFGEFTSAETIIDVSDSFEGTPYLKAVASFNIPVEDTPLLEGKNLEKSDKVITEISIEDSAPTRYRSENGFKSKIYYLTEYGILKFEDTNKPDDDEPNYSEKPLSDADLVLLRTAALNFSNKTDFTQSINPEIPAEFKEFLAGKMDRLDE